jgi:hypothetical protein
VPPDSGESVVALELIKSLLLKGAVVTGDVTFREDACRVRTGSAPQVLAEIRNTAHTLIRHTCQKPRPAREAFAERKWRAIRLGLNCPAALETGS